MCRSLLPMLGLALCATSAAAEPLPRLVTGNGNPFLHGLGSTMPALDGGADGPWSASVGLTLSNHADAGADGTEAVVLDGQSLYLDLEFRRQLTPRLGVGVAVPFVRHSGGALDAAIRRWHDIFDLTNARRDGPDNRLELAYERDGQRVFELTSPGAGLGDVRVYADWRVRGDAGATDAGLRLFAVVELPTGNASALRGNEAVDLGLGVAADFPALSDALGLAVAAGVVRPGDASTRAPRSRTAVPWAHATLAWSLGANWDALASLSVEGRYLDSSLEELGGRSTQLAVGLRRRAARAGTGLDITIIEDVSDNATPDFGLHLRLRGALP